ncbi:Holliday junction branch migration DNA helicase RuvB, partial [Streptomyces hirsutus]
MTRDEAETAALIERLVGSVADGEDQAVEAALRPKDLNEFIGQE